MPPPIPSEELEKIAEDACNTALGSTDTYAHESVESWNNAIINSILQTIVTSTPASPQYKYAVNSTIIQHLSDPTPSGSTTQTISPPITPAAPSTQLGANEADLRDGATPLRGGTSDERSSGSAAVEQQSGGATGSKPSRGRRGLHSAMGAYWNNETDGMWSYKFDGGDKKGMDVVISVIWVAV